MPVDLGSRFDYTEGVQDVLEPITDVPKYIDPEDGAQIPIMALSITLVVILLLFIMWFIQAARRTFGPLAEP